MLRETRQGRLPGGLCCERPAAEVLLGAQGSSLRCRTTLFPEQSLLQDGCRTKSQAVREGSSVFEEGTTISRGRMPSSLGFKRSTCEAYPMRTTIVDALADVRTTFGSGTAPNSTTCDGTLYYTHKKQPWKDVSRSTTHVGTGFKSPAAEWHYHGLRRREHRVPLLTSHVALRRLLVSVADISCPPQAVPMSFRASSASRLPSDAGPQQLK